MEATLRPYDRGEEVTPFATLGLYHAYRALPSYAYPLCFCCSYPTAARRGGGVGAKTSFAKKRLRGRAASAAYPARLNSQM